MKPLVLIVSFAFFSLTAASQPLKTVIQEQQAWIGYLNQTRFSNKWGLWTDLHFRRLDFLDRWNQQVYRVGLTHYLADNVRLTAGYAFVSSHLYPSNITRPEHRPWQQIWWSGRSGRLNLTQWVRVEERFNHRVKGDQLAEGFGFNWRVRYNFLAQVPLKGETIQPGVLNAVLQNETFINAGKQITYNYFDQNRFFVGLSYPIRKNLLIQGGYMNLFQQTAAGSTFVSNHTARLFVFHTLDLRQ